VSIAAKSSGQEVLERLRRALSVRWEDYVVLVAARLDGNPFAVLASIILSQNTSDKNSIKAYHRLREEVGVKPEDILSASLERLVEAIRPAGLPKQKAVALREAARLVASKGGENWLSSAPPEEVRSELLRVPGIGKKTVDVFLSFYRGYKGVFAVDTHAARIAKRWGLVGEDAGYDEVSRSLLEFFGGENAEEAHRLLIALGRTYCRARNPRCEVCPLRDICPWPAKGPAQARLRRQSRGAKGGPGRSSGT
jgi:endonuclease-3